GQHDIARGRAYAQGETPRRAEPLQSDLMNGAAMGNLEMGNRGARRAALKEPQHVTMNKQARAESLVRQSITGREYSPSPRETGRRWREAPDEGCAGLRGTRSVTRKSRLGAAPHPAVLRTATFSPQ